MQNLLTLTFTLVLLSFFSCKKDAIDDRSSVNNGNNNTNTPKNVNSFLSDDDEFTLFFEAITLTGIDAEINGNGPYTIFAPDDSAFNTFLSNNNWNTINDVPNSTLTTILKFHISKTDVKIADLTTGTNVPILFNNKEVYINIDDPAAPFVVLGLTQADVINQDMEQSNGMIHKINSVLSL